MHKFVRLLKNITYICNMPLREEKHIFELHIKFDKFDNDININIKDNKILDLILKNTILIMAKQDQLQLILTELEAATTAIAARIQALIDGGVDNITQASLDQLQSDADALKTMGSVTP